MRPWGSSPRKKFCRRSLRAGTTSGPPRHSTQKSNNITHSSKNEQILHSLQYPQDYLYRMPNH